MTAVRGAHSASPKENGPAQPNFPHPSAESASDACPTSELAHTWVHFVKTFVLIFPIYVLGYFEFSFSWLLIGLFIFFCWRRSTGGKRTRLSRALAFLDQEEERSAKQGLTTSDLPPWVRPQETLHISLLQLGLVCYFGQPYFTSFQENEHQLSRSGVAGLSCKAAMRQLSSPNSDLICPMSKNRRVQW